MQAATIGRPVEVKARQKKPRVPGGPNAGQAARLKGDNPARGCQRCDIARHSHRALLTDMRRRWEVDKNAPRKVDGAKHGAATSFVDDPADVVPPAPHYAIVADPLRPFAHPERVGGSAFPSQQVCQWCRYARHARRPSTAFCPIPLHPLEAFSANHARGEGWPGKAEEWPSQQDAVPPRQAVKRFAIV